MAFYYLSDLHLCHRQMALRRGFPSIEAHDQTLLENLRHRSTPNDTLFLLGDLFAYTFDSGLLEQLHSTPGHLVLIRGNHETRHWLRKADPELLHRTFDDILAAAEVTDAGRLVRLCHEPRPELHADDTYLLYGHLHDQPPRREDWKAVCANPRALNVSAEIGAYATGRWGEPATLDQWMFFNEVWRNKTPEI